MRRGNSNPASSSCSHRFGFETCQAASCYGEVHFQAGKRRRLYVNLELNGSEIVPGWMGPKKADFFHRPLDDGHELSVGLRVDAYIVAPASNPPSGN